MKNLHIFCFTCFILFFLIATGTCLAANRNVVLHHAELDEPFIVVEDLSATFHGTGNIVHLKGKFKNVSRSFLRGFLSIHLLTDHGQLIQTIEIPANNNNTFAHGSSITFDEVISIEQVPNASSINVEFTRQ